MGKNQKGGKGHKNGKNSINKTDKKLEFAGDLQKYAVITKILGNCRFRVSFVSENNVVDKLSPYCKQNAITIRPWKGRLPSIEYPRFI